MRFRVAVDSTAFRQHHRWLLTARAAGRQRGGLVTLARAQLALRVCRVVGVSLDLVVMILPQVHLRKPCYDFTFL
jgi:hypothetical protein